MSFPLSVLDLAESDEAGGAVVHVTDVVAG